MTGGPPDIAYLESLLSDEAIEAARAELPDDEAPSQALYLAALRAEVYRSAAADGRAFGDRGVK